MSAEEPNPSFCTSPQRLKTPRRSNPYNLNSPRVPFRSPIPQEFRSPMDASASNDPQPSTSSSRSPFNTVRSAFEALSAATAPSPRPKKTRGPSALEILTDHYGLADPPELHYNAPPPAYDDLFGSSKSFSKVDALKTIAKRVGRELTGGSKS